MTSAETEMGNTPGRRLTDMSVYTSTSMLMVFEPGDLLETDDDVAFQELAPGDIIVFPSKSRAGMNIVHRVISRDGDSLVTMGDNNQVPDADPVTPDQRIRLVTSRLDRNGLRHPVARGKDGMREFRAHRRRYRMAHFVSKVGRRLQPLMFWRRVPGETRRFGDTVFYYGCGRVVARKNAAGVRFTSRLWKLLYKIPSESSGSVMTNP